MLMSMLDEQKVILMMSLLQQAGMYWSCWSQVAPE